MIMMMLIWWCLYVYFRQHRSNIWSSIDEKLKQCWGWLEKNIGYKKACILLAPIMKAYLIHFLFRPKFDVVFARILHPDFVDSEILIWGLTSLTDFYKRAHLFFKKQHVSDCQKKISFVQITHLKFTFLTPCNIESY